MRILCWAQTDVGQKRDHNEDSFLVAADLGLYVVADGMGGHAGGDQASQMAVSVLHDTIRSSGLRDQPKVASLGEEPAALTVLRDGARAAGELIFDLAQQNPHLAGMGTTMTALLFHGGRVHLAHVGDSRAYLFRDGRIEQLSEDHSWINEQVKAGLITDEEARHSKFKHIITRSVGFEREVAVDVMSLPVLMGDCYMVCSDGLSNYMENDELGRLLTSNYYGAMPGLLTDIANERGGDDNITVLVVYIANDTGEPMVQDLSRLDPSQRTTVPGPELAPAVSEATQKSDEAAQKDSDTEPTPAPENADSEDPDGSGESEDDVDKALRSTDPALPAYDRRKDSAAPVDNVEEPTPEVGAPAARSKDEPAEPDDTSHAEPDDTSHAEPDDTSHAEPDDKSDDTSHAEPDDKPDKP